MSNFIKPDYIFFFALFVMAYSSVTHAVIGLPDNTARIGIALGAAQAKFDEPDGGSPEAENTVPLNFIATDWLFAGTRYWLDLFYLKSNYHPSDNVVGQNVRHTSLRALIQKNFRLSTHFSPWLGVGISVSQSRFTTRHTQATDGFLLQRFEDRSSNSLGFVINAAVDWEIQRNWFGGIKADQTFNSGNNLNTRGAALYFLYLY